MTSAQMKMWGGQRRFVCHFWFVSWDCISLGASVCMSKPNLEIHLPFGFVRIGWDHVYLPFNAYPWRLFGWDGRKFGIGKWGMTPLDAEGTHSK